MKKIFCVFMICCACFFTSACAYRNDINTRYTLNAVVEKTDRTDGVVTVEISPVFAMNIYDMEDSEDGFSRGYAVYRGDGRNYGNFFCEKSDRRLTYELEWEDDMDALSDMMSGDDGSRIIKFTVSKGRIVMFEDTYCEFIDHGTMYDGGYYDWRL